MRGTRQEKIRAVRYVRDRLAAGGRRSWSRPTKFSSRKGNGERWFAGRRSRWCPCDQNNATRKPRSPARPEGSQGRPLKRVRLRSHVVRSQRESVGRSRWGESNQDKYLCHRFRRKLGIE